MPSNRQPYTTFINPHCIQPHCTQTTHPINRPIRKYLSYRMSNCGNITFINGTRSGYLASSHTGRQSELVFLVHSAHSSWFTKLDSFSLAFYFVAMAFVRSGWHVLACWYSEVQRYAAEYQLQHTNPSFVPSQGSGSRRAQHPWVLACLADCAAAGRTLMNCVGAPCAQLINDERYTWAAIHAYHAISSPSHAHTISKQVSRTPRQIAALFQSKWTAQIRSVIYVCIYAYMRIRVRACCARLHRKQANIIIDRSIHPNQMHRKQNVLRICAAPTQDSRRRPALGSPFLASASIISQYWPTILITVSKYDRFP